MDLALHDRVYIVTGGTRGLGFAVASALVAEGARVVVSSRSPENVADAVSRLGPQATGTPVDVRDANAPATLIREATTTFGRLDGAFISHGGPPPGPATELDDALLDDAIDLALVAPIRMCREIAASLHDGGSVVVLTSTSSVQPYEGLATSNVARPAVWAFVKTLANELGPRGIRVNALLPGRFATERIVEYEKDLAARRGVPLEDVRDESEAQIPLRRLGEPAELGRVATFLLSPAASYVTGSAWLVDGGATQRL